ncbi:uncharacterized protein LOC130993105 [Salvia miltiorrhiza]|uniref:uncharacterized protein LOC130993105 n=1 Tax=Salvia miltiorrhiza TaxID=226208 RepID=UPI0025AC1385|nr:uncharacterized protein LOC130993105 [Salvia miltiorrhiza]
MLFVRFVVDVDKTTCTCREWDLTGIPCIHAMSALHYMGRDPIEVVHEYYHVATYLKAYEVGLEPCRGESMWPVVESFKVKPPEARRMPGRPKKKRLRSATEREGRNPHQLSRGGMVMTCRRCGNAGHNKRNCQNLTLEIPPPPKNKVGRPSKTRAEDMPSSSSTRGRFSRGSGRGGGRSGRGSARGGRSDVFFRERNTTRSGLGLYISEATRN